MTARWRTDLDGEPPDPPRGPTLGVLTIVFAALALTGVVLGVWHWLH